MFVDQKALTTATRMGPSPVHFLYVCMLLLCTWPITISAEGAISFDADLRRWWDPNEAGRFESHTLYPNESGALGVVNADGSVEVAHHPFFRTLGENGRACVTCHQPADAMSLSVTSIQRRWEETDGTDPLFAAIDGSNCPSAPQGERGSHSLLLEHGLFRIPLPWPPRTRDGAPIEPEFTIEVVSDPTGCNADPRYGLASTTPMVSVYRRPRVAANLKYITRAGAPINLKNGRAMDVDPETGKPVTMNLLSDARHPTLKLQALDAARVHLQAKSAPSATDLAEIEAFLGQIYLAQEYDREMHDLSEGGRSEWLGPRAMERGKVGVLGDNLSTPVFGPLDQWASNDGMTASIERGYRIFMLRPFWIRDVTYLNSIGLGNPVKRTCSTCHNNMMTGMDLAPGWMDIGTANRPWAEARADLPLFKLTCAKTANPHPYLGRTILTHDPGRALITGRCVDIGSITIQQLRGLAARAPYFAHGGARDLDEVVRFYDRRFDMRLTEQEIIDLRNFLSVL